MTLDVSLVGPEEVRDLRELRRHDMHCQIVLDSWHARGWTDSYMLRIDGRIVGYGLVGGVRGDPKDVVTEFYVSPHHRAHALPLFRRLVALSEARSIEAQSNDVLLTLMLFDCSHRIESTVILFHDAITTSLAPLDATFRRSTEADEGRAFEHAGEPVGDWLLEVDGAIVATGGTLFHYNIPYGDIFMEVAESHRRRGLGSYLVQELKRVCREMGRIPAARCNASNAASRATLQKAGMLPCARMLTGVLERGDAVGP